MLSLCTSILLGYLIMQLFWCCEQVALWSLFHGDRTDSDLRDLQEILALVFKGGGEVMPSLMLCSKQHLLFQE